ncbi:Pentatricopeptide repeat-containing protein [Spatholobus suberectus]|nr:Pentatricopeptide repeat-containing protein [Spatholobus suberectus]
MPADALASPTVIDYRPFLPPDGKGSYHCPDWFAFSTMASMYIRMDQAEKAEECLTKVQSRIKENFFEEWISVKSSCETGIGNFLLGWYVKKGNTDKTLSFFEQMKEGGGIPNSNTWEVLSVGHIADKRISEALSCLKEAFMGANGSKSWLPKPFNLSAFLELCQEQDDMASAEVLIGLLRQSKFSKNKVYASLIGSSDGAIGKGELSSKIDTADRTDDIVDGENLDGDSQMLFKQLESSL